MSTTTELPETIITGAANAALIEGGFGSSETGPDRSMVRARIFELVSKAKVLKKGERNDKAISRGALMATVLPDVPGPDAWADQDNPLLAELVYKHLDSKWVWGETNPDQTKQVQRMVESIMGNGYVLCRTKIVIEGNAIDAVYVTDDYECIRLDLVTPENLKFARVIESMTATREMLQRRQHANAKRILREFEKATHDALTASVARLRLGVESADADADADAEPDAE